MQTCRAQHRAQPFCCPEAEEREGDRAASPAMETPPSRRTEGSTSRPSNEGPRMGGSPGRTSGKRRLTSTGGPGCGVEVVESPACSTALCIAWISPYAYCEQDLWICQDRKPPVTWKTTAASVKKQPLQRPDCHSIIVLKHRSLQSSIRLRQSKMQLTPASIVKGSKHDKPP
mmetsp:Transcript_1644/g.2942  ORF Transcript_1644/g.2942 Transcript_1644/m.2942 type:complete len:172 (-) Transcript_1644:344-859(-)